MIDAVLWLLVDLQTTNVLCCCGGHFTCVYQYPWMCVWGIFITMRAISEFVRTVQYFDKDQRISGFDNEAPCLPPYENIGRGQMCSYISIWIT